MKIHSVAWGWTPTPEDMPGGDSLLHIADQVKALGFDGVDYLSTFESLDTYFTKAECERIRDHVKGLGLSIGGFVFQSDLWNSPDQADTDKQLAYFGKCAQAADWLGAKIISCIVPGPYGAKGTRRDRSPSEKVTSNLPKGYDWDADWARFTGTLAKACDIAAKYDITVALECFPRSLCATPHAMLQAIKDVNRPNFGIQMDTAHLMNQNIDVETTVYMLRDHIKHVHLKDTDGLTRGNLPCGSGLVDYARLFAVLKDIGYKGRASVEVEFTDNPRRYMRDALHHVNLCLDGSF